MSLLKRFALLAICLGVAACQSSTTTSSFPRANDIPPQAPKSLKIGKPYTIKGKAYYPEYDPNYDRTGIASWYGPGFHGKKTATGEIYDQYAMTAAHPTLPMPSMVRVTNLKNGQTIIVRINDRGPFAPGRIIDLSKRAAETIGIKGIEKVRVEYLKEETERYWASTDINLRGLKGVDLAAYQSEQSVNVQPDILEQQAMKAAPAPIMSVSSVQVSDIGSHRQHTQKHAHAQKKPDWPKKPHSKEVVITATNRLEDNVEIAYNTEPPPTVKRRTSKVADVAPSDNDVGYFIQAGAFSSKRNANRVMKKISHLSNVFIETLPRASGILHRVRVGPYASHGDASDMLHELFKAGIKEAAVVSIK